jgi:hypothetical protein
VQTGLFISRKMDRDFFRPRYATLWTRASQLANVKVMLHGRGVIRDLLSDLTEAALDAANSVQTSCQEMEPTGMKSEFGRTMVDCRLMLEQGFSLSRRTH